jgi:hypothetical protein
MEKTEMMKKYEETTYLDDDPQALIQIIEYLKECIQDYKSKAAAYDRLMSCGKKTLKEWANILQMYVAVDRYDNGWAFTSAPRRNENSWWPEPFGNMGVINHIPANRISFTGDWTTSLTLPDGWETKGENK